MYLNHDWYTASGRHLCSNQYMTLSMMMDACDEYCGKRGIKRSIPCCRCDCSCCWCFIMCIACCQSKGDADYLRGAVNKGTHYDNTKLRKMGFEFRDNDSTMIYTLDYLAEAGFIGKKWCKLYMNKQGIWWIWIYSCKLYINTEEESPLLIWPCLLFCDLYIETLIIIEKFSWFCLTVFVSGIYELICTNFSISSKTDHKLHSRLKCEERTLLMLNIAIPMEGKKW